MGGQSEAIVRSRAVTGRSREARRDDGAVDTHPRRGRRGVIDAVDLAIIEQLSMDGRMSSKHLGEHVGLTDASVAARLRSLVGHDIVRVRAVVDWEVAGLRSPIVFFVRVHGRSMHGLAEQLLANPQVQSVSDVFGSADLIVRVLLADPIDAMTFAEERLGAIDGLEIVMSLLDVEIAKHANGFHTGGLPPTDVPAFPTATSLLDSLDGKLLSCLVHDGRQSLRKIGRLLDVSEHTIRARLRRLEEVGLVRICAQVDQAVMADNAGGSAYVALRAHNGRVPSIIDDLVAQDQVLTVDRTIGEYNLLALTAARSHADLANVLDHIRLTAGVERSESWFVSSQQLGSFPWAHFGPTDRVAI